MIPMLRGYGAVLVWNISLMSVFTGPCNQAKEQKDQDKQREELRLKMSGSRRLKSAVIMKKRLSSIVHGRASSSSSSGGEDHPPPAPKDSKDKKSKEEGGNDKDRIEVKDNDSKEDSNSGIELITSSEDEDGPSRKRPK